ncbi:hypothetical protein [Rhodanobacter sp. DHG33]|uniref:hypothetical protein n=1 Tax=Rhodanobacter sp. DHG33 TaxID=2775921 RepID=UPI0017847A2B|nr:hypothetical protein [Rhodanobacter sp. DHG33]MBD8900007.1 hypothetical protein [Rhodanobacter sp. DHG33]
MRSDALPAESMAASLAGEVADIQRPVGVPVQPAALPYQVTMRVLDASRLPGASCSPHPARIARQQPINRHLKRKERTSDSDPPSSPTYANK